jgi:hypothetical protein
MDLVTARSRAESLMTSTCSIAPPGAVPLTDVTTGEVTVPAGTAVYEGPCRVRPNRSTQASDGTAGGAEVFASDYLVGIPFDEAGSANVRERMVCTIGTSPDPALVGMIFEIQMVARGDNITARRLACNKVA